MIDVIVRFASEMPRLVALCIAFFHLDSDVVEEVNQRIAEEVLPSKSPLWFCLNDVEPKPSDSDVPLVHYQEMISPLAPAAAPKRNCFLGS